MGGISGYTDEYFQDVKNTRLRDNLFSLGTENEPVTSRYEKEPLYDKLLRHFIPPAQI